MIVESPTKAKTIRKFLGKDFIVESCMGHVRDLPQSSKDIPEKYRKEKWAQLGVNVSSEFEPIYCVPRNKEKVVSTLREKLKDASELYLATDEDREGESISWHLKELLKPKIPMKRMVFNEITKEAIARSLKETRGIDQNLVHAQEARRILDRLVGYTISPLLWKKVAYGLSAGRVQSVAVKLISMREMERLKFRKAKYFGALAQFEKNKIEFEAKLHTWNGSRIATGKDFDGSTGELSKKAQVVVLSEKEAKEASAQVQKTPFEVIEVEEKPVSRKPAPPFITSTLQQEANRKFGLSAREAMQVAQKLYEQGFITYMRTDSTFLSEEAIAASRSCIQKKYGKEFLPPQFRNYASKKVKGAQEAHEAIRPAGSTFQDPDETGLSGLQFKLYDLIWKRTVASQMVDSKQKQVSAQLKNGKAIFSANGMTIEFPGFLRAYVEGSDDPEAELAEREVQLPPLKKADQLKALSVEPTEHETKPPARYTEASLVQTLEREGVGRPSTYASIMSTIVDRGYVRKEGSALIPTFTALVVSHLLNSHLPQYVDVGFTSEMEKSLDLIADGDLESVDYLKKIYLGGQGLKKLVETQEKKIDPEQARSIRLEGLEKYSFRVGKYGAYVCKPVKGGEVCASIPDKEAPADVTAEQVETWIEQKEKGHDALGVDPKSKLPVYVLTGRYGPYVQLGEGSGAKDKPKRVSLPAETDLKALTLPEALNWLSLPKTLGEHPEKKKPVQVGLGRFGPYVVCDGEFRSIPKTDSLFAVSFQRALEILAAPKKGRGRAQALKDLGKNPKTEENVQLFDGPYGLYVKSGKINASVPKGTDASKVTLAMALELITEKKKAS